MLVPSIWIAAAGMIMPRAKAQVSDLHGISLRMQIVHRNANYMSKVTIDKSVEFTRDQKRC
jgi:hypothetical protein